MSKVEVSEGTTKFRANHPEALEHIRSRFAGPLATPLESEALRRGLISVDIPTLYNTLRTFHSDIFARVSREVEPDALSSALATIVCDAVGQSIYEGADPEVISSELCNRLDSHSLFYCTIDNTFLGVQMNHLMRSHGRRLGHAYGSHRQGGGGERDHHSKNWGYAGGGGNFHNNNNSSHLHAPHHRHHSNPSGAHWPHNDTTAQHGNALQHSNDNNNQIIYSNTYNSRSTSDSNRQQHQQRFSQGGPENDGRDYHSQKQDAPYDVDGGSAPQGTDMSSASMERRYHTAHACVDFMHGKCARGDLCRFSHEPEAQSTTQRSNHYNAVMMNNNNNHNNHYSNNSTVNNSHYNTNIGGHPGRGGCVATSREPAAFHSQPLPHGHGQHNFHQHHQQQHHHAYGNDGRSENHQHHHHGNNNNVVEGASNLPTPTQTYRQGHHLPCINQQNQLHGRVNGYSNNNVSGIFPIRDIATANNSASTSAASLMNAPHPLHTPSNVMHNSGSAPPPLPATGPASGPPPPPPEMLQSRRATAPPPPPPQALLSAPPPPPPRSQSDAGAGTPTPSSPSTASSSSPLHSHISNISTNQKSEASVTLNPYPFRRSACASQSASTSGGGGVAPPAPVAALPTAHDHTNSQLMPSTIPKKPTGTYISNDVVDDDQPLVPFLEANGQAHLVDPLRNGGFTLLSQLKALTVADFEQKLKVRICSRSIRSSLWDVLHPDNKGAISLPPPVTTTANAAGPVEPSGRVNKNKTTVTNSTSNLLTTTAKVGVSHNSSGSGGTTSILRAFLANNDIKSGGESVAAAVTKSPSKAIVAAHALNSLLHVPVAVTSSACNGNSGGGKTADTPAMTPSPSPTAATATTTGPTASSPTITAAAATATQVAPSAAQQQQQDIRAILWLRASLSTPFEEMKAAVATVGRFFECGLADYSDGGTQWAYFKLAAYDKELQAMKSIVAPTGGRLVIADRTLFAGGHKDNGLAPLLPVEVRDRLVRSQDEPSPSPLPHPHPTRGGSRTNTHTQQSPTASHGGNLSMMGARANTYPSSQSANNALHHQTEPKARGGPQREKGLLRPTGGRGDRGDGAAGEREKENNKDKEKAPPVCRFFLRRSCTKGDACPYRHDANKQERTVARQE